VCLPCRVSWKLGYEPGAAPRVCPRCRGPLINAGFDLAIPRRRDLAGWRTLAATLRAGVRFFSCGCSGPGYRPRRWSEVRDRRTVAARRGVPEATTLVRRDPWTEPATDRPASTR
jgi:hypothetical protein